MGHTDGHGRIERLARPLVVAGLLAVLLVGCARGQQVQVTAPPRPTTSLPAGPVSSFQGQVAAVDAQVGEILVAVQIVWAPVMKAGAHERRVLVDPHTRWDPPQVTLAGLRAGEEVQIKALDSDDGTWRAVEVQLIDID